MFVAGPTPVPPADGSSAAVEVEERDNGGAGLQEGVPPALPATASTEIPAIECPDTFLIFGDTQIPYLKTRSAIRSSIINSRSPAVRLPLSELAVPSFYYYLVKQHYADIPEQCRELSDKGGFLLGDVGDTAAKPEPEYFAQAQGHVEQSFPGYKLRTIAPGNHDAFPNGTFNNGEAFLGLIGILLNVEGRERSFIDNVATYEVGSKDQLLNKEDFLRFMYRELQLPWTPVELKDSSQSDYSLDGEKSQVDWKRSGEVARTFWRQAPDGKGYYALVHYTKDEEALPEQKWLTLHAVPMGEYGTEGGSTPVYAITLDSIDFIEDSSTDGALFGHLSYVQTRLVQAFMTQMKIKNPRTRFILSTHFGLHDIDEPWSNTLRTLFTPSRWTRPKSLYQEILEDESVMAILAAHRHAWDYQDLNDAEYRAQLGLKKRRSPLPQISIPSLIDNPLGGGSLRLYARGPDLVLDFKRRELNPAPIRAAASAQVLQELAKIKSHLVTYVPAWHNMQDKIMKILAHPDMDLGRGIPYILDYDFGILYEPGKISDELLAKDVVPLMVETAQVKLRAYMAALRLTLYDLELPSDADVLDLQFHKQIGLLDGYYQLMVDKYSGRDPMKAFEHKERTAEVQQSMASSPQQSAEIVEKYSEELDRTYLTTIDHIRLHLKELPPDHSKRGILVQAESMARDLYALMHVYKEWLKRYEGMLAARRTPNEIGVMTDLMVSAEWERVQQTIRDLPFESSAGRFVTLAGMSSTESRDHFFRRFPHHREMPRKILVTSNIKTGEVQITPVPPRYTAEQKSEALAIMPYPQGWSRDLLTDYLEEVDHPRHVGHWMARVGGSLDVNNASFHLHLGGQGHWFPEKFGYLRLSGLGGVEMNSHGRRGTEFLVSGGPQLDLLGNVALGAFGSFGLALGNQDKGGEAVPVVGVGGDLQFMEGLIFLRLMKQWYGQPQAKWEFQPGNLAILAGVDVFGLMRFTNWWDRYQ